MAYSIQHEYLQTVLIIGFGESKRSAIRITNLYNFASVTTGALVGLTIYRVRHLQPFIMCGTALYFSALVLLCLFPGGQGKDAHYVVVFGQVLLGIGGGLFPFPTMASIQAATDHKYMTVITGLYFAVYRIGSAIGSCVAATIWLGVLPSRFRGRLSSNEALWAVNAPFTFTSDSNYSPEAKVAFLECYKDIQRILCIVAASVSALLIVFAFVIRNPKLGDEQSLPDPSSFELQDLPARHHDNRTENNLNVPDIYGGQRPPGTPRSAQTGSDPQLDISPEPHTPLGKH
jgi:SIT family siderophore-iron:H+ symporter-like MFS transporter